MFWLLFLLAPLAFAAEVVIDRGIDYTSIPHGKLAMDVVHPKAAGKYPGIVLIHGGGFSGGSRSSYLPMAIKLARTATSRRPSTISSRRCFSFRRRFIT